MLRFRDIPIKGKLMLVIMLTSTAALLLATVTVVMFSWRTVRRGVASDLEAVANIVGANSTAAISFNDRKAAKETLASVNVRSEVISAQVCDRDGTVLADFERDASPSSAKVVSGHLLTTADADRYLSIVHPIILNGEMIGTVRLQADLRQIQTRLKELVTVIWVLVLVSWLVALALSTYLQRSISAPILALADVTRQVQERGDYSLRAHRESKDEIGVLVDGLNQMLAQVQSQDEKLRASEERFRQLAENIHEAFWMTDVGKNQMIYISPGYEIIWGRTRESLYVDSLSWMEAIHPDDRERVYQAVLMKQAAGGYDEEYRIALPSGKVRWIHDRAYPVRNDTGQVYRIVGIAEDVTERKHLEEEILHISDRERRRIGQDIHDGLCQHLAGTAFAAKALEQTLAELDSPQTAGVRQIVGLISEAITQARDIARGLSPVELGPHGLTIALEHLAANVGSMFDVSCSFRCQQAVSLWDNATAVHLYRIAQEAVNNAIKHGQPKHVWVALTSVNGRINLTVEDDGVGIVEATGQIRGMGLQIMVSRAKLMGGQLDVHRQPGGGTIVTCSVDAALNKQME